MSAPMTYTADEFGRESAYLDTLIWESLCVEKSDRVLFCGYGPDATWVRRAIDSGATVTVIEHRDGPIRRFANLDATLMRGSTSVIPAKESTFDVAIATHYLHETDPFFHAQIVSELARVAKRIVVVEPSPPSDPLGKRIALLYSQAKRELGQFEYYQPIDYWKKLLQAVKAEVSQNVFAFSKVPPSHYLADTIRLLLDTMEVEEAPPQYLEELRAIARRPGAMLLPQARFVLVGATAGEMPAPVYTQREEPKQAAPVAEIAALAPSPVPAKKITAEAGYEFPPVMPPADDLNRFGASAEPATPPSPGFGLPSEPPPAFVPGLPFGMPVPPDAPTEQNQVPPPEPPAFGAPFAMPEFEPAPGWAWEPPEGDEEPPKPFGL